MPDFQFLTTDNPEEFKKGNYLKQIRSHAMLSVKHNEQQQQRSKSGQAPPKPSEPSTSSRPGASASPPLVSEPQLRAGRPVKFVDYNPTKAAEKGSRKRSLQNQDDDDRDDQRAVASIPRKSAKARTSFFAQYANAVLKPRQVGRGADVLNTMPEFSNPKISVWDLKRQFDDLMLTETMKAFYFPAMDGCRHAFLSTACIKATYADMLNGFVEESPATLYIKEEVYTMIRESLVDPKRQADDGMFMCIGQLLAAELVQGEEDVMMTHEQGLDQIAEARGGLDQFGGQGVIANALSAVALVSAIVREGEAPQRFFDHLDHPVATATAARLAESPIFCPRDDFYNIAPLCSEQTLRILRDMRDMTNLFVHSEKTVRRQTLRGEYPYPRQLSSQLWSFHNRMLDLPPNTDPTTFFDPVAAAAAAAAAGKCGYGGAAAKPDFVYEACRHAAILYSYAIAARVPISTAGQYFERAYPQMAVRVDIAKVFGDDQLYPDPAAARPAAPRSASSACACASARCASSTSCTPPSTGSTTTAAASRTAATPTSPPTSNSTTTTTSSSSSSPQHLPLITPPPPLQPPLCSSTHPALAIVDAIQRTPNAQDAWGDLVGVLMWVSFVATAAARAPPPPSAPSSSAPGGSPTFGEQAASSSSFSSAASPSASSTTTTTTSSGASPAASSASSASASSASASASPPPPSSFMAGVDARRDYERARARKNLASVAVLCLIRLAFEQPRSIFPALRTFLRVQGLLRR
ncbi:peroxisomal catalase [Diplodia corticola]|uniref:Peroxisomal catalase n=1 Tax=Diplodia corticola TaxID=236234 RepID=A0A1J9RYX2_9PEZI|nr:peroxisomal catalase [Diplodia corticola]OJD33551.1 peroxisomal catalase [Diplodia corticola]